MSGLCAQVSALCVDALREEVGGIQEAQVPGRSGQVLESVSGHSWKEPHRVLETLRVSGFQSVIIIKTEGEKVSRSQQLPCG